MTSLVDADVAARWDNSFAAGTDKKYPNLEVVRLELWHFGHKPGRLLEYAFGSGVNTLHLAECGHEIDAIDASAQAKKLVEGKFARRPDLQPRVRLHHLPADAKRLPFADNTFDYVVAISVLSLLSTKERIGAVLGELARVLKPGGKIIVDINSAESQFAIDGKHLGDDIFENRGRSGDEPPVRCFCPTNIETFKALVAPHFVIDDAGWAGHSYYKNQIHEFLISAHKA